MRKVELLPTRDCEAGCGPERNYLLSLAVSEKQYLRVLTHFAWSHHKCDRKAQFVIHFCKRRTPLTYALNFVNVDVQP